MLSPVLSTILLSLLFLMFEASVEICTKLGTTNFSDFCKRNAVDFGIYFIMKKMGFMNRVN